MDKTQYIFGLRAIIEAIEAGRDIDKVLLRKGLQGDLAKELLTLIKAHDLPMQWVPTEKLNRITMRNHQGAIALLSAVTYYPLEQVVSQTFDNSSRPDYRHQELRRYCTHSRVCRSHCHSHPWP